MDGQEGLNLSGYPNSIQPASVIDSIPAFTEISQQYAVFCQGCGNELTHKGGMVSASGKVYCDSLSINGNNFCLDKEIIPMVKGLIPKKAIAFNYKSPEKLQEAIRNNVLTGFGPLELKTK